jgi:hypothetical protein
MNFDPKQHNAAVGLALVQVVPKINPDQPGDYWLDPDGVHLHAPWNITKAGAPDKRARPQVLVHRETSSTWAPEGRVVGHYVLTTPENMAAVEAYNRKATELELARKRAQAEMHNAVAIVLPAKPEGSA